MTSTPISSVQLLTRTIQTLRPTKEQAASFEAILTSPDNCGKHAVAAILWARSLPFAKQLPEKNGPLVQLLSLPLLVWGMRQPWAEMISASHVINFWFKHQVSPMLAENRALDEAWATRTIASCALDPLANRARADDLCREWYWQCDSDADAWKFSMASSRSQGQLYEAWLDMYRMALPDLRNLEKPQETLQKTWLSRLGPMLREMAPEQQSGFMLCLLASDLPAVTKIAACKKSSSLSWLDPDVHSSLLSLLPINEHARYGMLPWVEYKSHLRAVDVASDNEAIANLYCPNLAPAFSIMLQPGDWTNRAAVCKAVDMAHPKKATTYELPIGDLVI